MHYTKSPSLLLSISIILTFVLAGCMDASLSQSGGSAPTGISLQQAPDGVEEVTISVSGPGMDTVTETISAGSGEVVLDIPVGEDREFTAEAGGYRASVVRDVPAGGITVSLRFGLSDDVSGEILFTAAFENSDFDIYSVAPDGTGLTQITETSDIYYARYTPDGSQIVFLRGDPSVESVDLYVMDAHDPATMEQLATGIYPADNFDLRGSFAPQFFKIAPDGSSVAYRSSDNGQIYSVSLSGDGPSTQLTTNYNTDSPGTWSWSEDGTKIAYPGIDETENPGLWVTDLDTNTQQVVNEPIYSFDWLGDGSNSIVYSGLGSLYVTSETGGVWTQEDSLVDTGADFVQSDPSGDTVFYVGTTETENYEFFKIPVDDSSGFGEPTQVTNYDSPDLVPFASWSPDGERIAGYLSDSETNNLNIVYGNSDGSDDFSTIGDSSTMNTFADWGPSGDSLLYFEYVEGTDETLEEVRFRVADLSGSSGPVDLLQEADSAPVGIGTAQWRP